MPPHSAGGCDTHGTAHPVAALRCSPLLGWMGEPWMRKWGDILTRLCGEVSEAGSQNKVVSGLRELLLFFFPPPLLRGLENREGCAGWHAAFWL